MHFGEAIATVFFRKYATFKGRAPRSEFWWAWLFVIVVNIALRVASAKEIMEGEAGLGLLLFGLWSLFILQPMLAVMTRRLHDTGRSGWLAAAWVVFAGGATFVTTILKDMHLEGSLPDWGLPVLLALAAGMLLFGLFILYCLCKRGDSGHNIYGPPPL